MQRILKFTLWTVAALVALPLAYLALLLLWNRFDEPLNPAAAALIEARPAGGVAADNAYFVLIGLTAPKEMDPLAAGIALDKLYFETYAKETRPSALPDPSRALQGPAAKLQLAANLRCQWQTSDCLAQFAARGADYAAVIAERAYLLERYRRLQAMATFQDRPFLSMNEPVATPHYLADLDLLAQADIAMLAGQGNHAEAAARLALAIANARRILASTHQLLGKLIFAQILQNNLALLNALAGKHGPMAAAWQAQPNSRLPAMTAAERDLAPVATAETRALARLLADPATGGREAPLFDAPGRPAWYSTLGRLAWKRNATINLLAASGPFNILESKWKRDQEKREVKPSLSWPSGSMWNDFVDNPVGRILLAVAAAEWGDFADRMIDTDGYLRLTSLHMGIRALNSGADAIPAFLTAEAGRLGDPHTGKPMQWDAAKRVLSFQGHAPASAAGPKDPLFTIALGAP